METNWTKLLEFLNFSGADTLFEQRELLFQRVPYEMEKTLYRFITDGKPKEMMAFYQRMILETPALKVAVGRTSRNRLMQLKYAAVSAVALACRAAIEGGAIESCAYAKSDEAIVAIDEAKGIPEVLRLEVQMVYDYAQMVQETKSLQNCSAAVRACVDYITVHSHGVIKLEELSDGTGYTKEYLAKLFKKEMGISTSDYILKVRIDEAKDLLNAGRSCGEVTHLLGFSSQSYFIRQFKKVTGMTPKLFIHVNS